MEKEIKTGVLLTLKDSFSQNIGRAAGAASGFAGKTLGSIEKVDKALSGTAAKLAAFGLTLSVGAAGKGIMEFDHRMTRLGLTANASAEQIVKMKRDIYDAAMEAKVDPNEILAGLEVITEKVPDLQFVTDNIRNIGLAIQATGEGGAPIGDIMSEFAKFGYTAGKIKNLMDDFIVQGDQGGFTFGEYAKNAEAVFSAYSAIGNTPAHMLKANAAMQILRSGTKNAEVSVHALDSMMSELSDKTKQDKLREMGILVRDDVTGAFRDFNDIMFDIVAEAKRRGNADYFTTIFGSLAMKAVRSYLTQGERMFDKVINLGDTAGKLEFKAAEMAGTLKSNITNLQTAFNRFVNSKAQGPMRDLLGGLNKLAEDPKRIEAVFAGAAAGITAIAAVKGIAGISRLIGSFAQLQGKKVDLGGALSMAAAMPVYVTNWGGIGAAGMALRRPDLVPGRFGRYHRRDIPPQGAGPGPAAPVRTGAAGTILRLAPAAVFAGLVEAGGRMDELYADKSLEGRASRMVFEDKMSRQPFVGYDHMEYIKSNPEALTMEKAFEILLQERRPRRRGPGLLSRETLIPVSDLPKQITQPSAPAPQKVDFEGRAVMDVNINLSGSRPTATADIRNNTTPVRFNTGSAPWTRMMNP